VIEFIKEMFVEESANFHIFEKIDNISRFTKNILNCDEVIVWFDNSKEDKFWSYHDNHQISVNRTKLLNILDDKTEKYIYKTENSQFINKLEELIALGSIENTLFHKIGIENNKYTVFVQIVNFHGGVKDFSRNIDDLIEILSFFISQTIKMEDISKIADYYHDEQEKAFKKQKTVIKNEFKSSSIFNTEIFYRASDILSGDTYSLLKAKNGDFLIYLIDAMGHGIAPSLTAYSLSAIIQQKIKNSSNFHDIMETVLDNVQYILTDEEQLTCGFFWFSSNLQKVDYVVAGMYAPLILDGDETVSVKANNIPFMNFAFDFTISTIELKNFKKMLIFSDGLVEETEDLNIEPEQFLKDSKYRKESLDILYKTNLEDDTTVLFFEKR
jgi:serine phosphatase RsbU (regulator of sigma subunit)